MPFTGCHITEDAKIDVHSEIQKKTMRKHKKPPPKFRLKTSGCIASLEAPINERIPLMLTDIQHLLLHSLLHNINLTEPPRWYVLERGDRITQTNCLIIEGLSIKHWEKYKDELEHTKKVFNDFVEILTPSIYNGSLVQELALVPLSEAEKDSIIQKYGSMNLALEARKDLMVMMKAVFPVGIEAVTDKENSSKDQFPRTQLVLSAWQLAEENYPLPLKGKLKEAYSDYVMTKDEYQSVTAQSPLFGVDCEMCITNAGSELTRVSVVNENHEVLYESYVKPYNDITDYLTRYSGVTKTSLENVTKRLEDVQDALRKLLPPDAILVGQSLNADLHALKMMHPYIIDTSLIYNFTGERTRKPKLKTLAKEFLNEDIQLGQKGHCSIEDSITSIKLVQLKLSKSMEYGDAVHTNRQKYKEKYGKMMTTEEYAFPIFNHMIEQKKTSLIVGCDDITGDYHSYLSQAKESLSTQLKKGKPKKIKLNTVDDHEEVISTLTQSVNDYNFTMAHIKLDINEDNAIEKVRTIDSWIKTVWDKTPQSALCVVVFGGTVKDNGVAMAQVKT